MASTIDTAINGAIDRQRKLQTRIERLNTEVIDATLRQDNARAEALLKQIDNLKQQEQAPARAKVGAPIEVGEARVTRERIRRLFAPAVAAPRIGPKVEFQGNTFEEAIEEANRLDEKVTDLKNKIEAAQQAAKQQLEKANKQIEELEDEKTKLEQQLQERTADETEDGDEDGQRAQEIRKLKQELEQIKKALEKSVRIADEHQAEIKRLEANIQQLRKERVFFAEGKNRAEREAATLRQTLEDGVTDAEVQARLTKLETEANTLRESNESLELQLAEVKQQLATALAAQQNAESEAEEAKNLIKSATSDLQEELKKANEKRESLQKEKEQLEQEISTAYQETQEVLQAEQRQQAAWLAEQLTAAKAVVTECLKNDQVATYKEEIEGALQQVGNDRFTSSVNSSYGELETKHTAIQDELGKLTKLESTAQNLPQLQEQATQLLAKKNGLLARCFANARAIYTLHNRVMNAKAAAQAKKARNEVVGRKEREVKSLESKLDEAESKIEELSQRSEIDLSPEIEVEGEDEDEDEFEDVVEEEEEFEDVQESEGEEDVEEPPTEVSQDEQGDITRPPTREEIRSTLLPALKVLLSRTIGLFDKRASFWQGRPLTLVSADETKIWLSKWRQALKTQLETLQEAIKDKSTVPAELSEYARYNVQETVLLLLAFQTSLPKQEITLENLLDTINKDKSLNPDEKEFVNNYVNRFLLGSYSDDDKKDLSTSGLRWALWRWNSESENSYFDRLAPLIITRVQNDRTTGAQLDMEFSQLSNELLLRLFGTIYPIARSKDWNSFGLGEDPGQVSGIEKGDLPDLDETKKHIQEARSYKNSIYRIVGGATDSVAEKLSEKIINVRGKDSVFDDERMGLSNIGTSVSSPSSSASIFPSSSITLEQSHPSSASPSFSSPPLSSSRTASPHVTQLHGVQPLRNQNFDDFDWFDE